MKKNNSKIKPLILIDKIDKYLEGYKGRDRTSHYPSQASIQLETGEVIGKCLRAQYYSWTRVKPTNPISATALWKMKMGNAIHSEVVRWLRSMGYEVQSEYPVEYKHPSLTYPMRGRIDDVLVFPKIHEFYGVECKSSWSKFFTDPKLGIAKCGPKKSDLLQVKLYLIAEKDINAFYLIYIARDNGQRYEFYVERESSYLKDLDLDQIMARWFTLEYHLLEKTLPPRDFIPVYLKEKQELMYEIYLKETKAKKPQSFKTWVKVHTEDWQCAYCQYWNRCKHVAF